MSSDDRKRSEAVSTLALPTCSQRRAPVRGRFPARNATCRPKVAWVAAAVLFGTGGCTPPAEPSDGAESLGSRTRPDVTVSSKYPDGSSGPSPLSASYSLAGRDIALHDGRHDEVAAPGSAARNSTSVWGNPLAADLDGDGDFDSILILVNEPGGTGTFYYVAVAERDADGYRGSEAVLLGDRIAPQGIAFDAGIVAVSFAERRPDEPASAAPSVGVTRRFSFLEHELRELPIDTATRSR